MMSGAKIFLIDKDGKNAREMVETVYEAGEVLQELLVFKPALLPGDQISPENPRDWLLAKREMEIPAGGDESDRWSFDHLSGTKRHCLSKPAPVRSERSRVSDEVEKCVISKVAAFGFAPRSLS
jgi:hypothetical protein